MGFPESVFVEKLTIIKEGEPKKEKLHHKLKHRIKSFIERRRNSEKSGRLSQKVPGENGRQAGGKAGSAIYRVGPD